MINIEYKKVPVKEYEKQQERLKQQDETLEFYTKALLFVLLSKEENTIRVSEMDLLTKEAFSGRYSIEYHYDDMAKERVIKLIDNKEGVMNKEIMRLHKHISIFNELEMLEQELGAFAADEDITTIKELNDLMETKLAYMALSEMEDIE